MFESIKWNLNNLEVIEALEHGNPNPNLDDNTIFFIKDISSLN